MCIAYIGIYSYEAFLFIDIVPKMNITVEIILLTKTTAAQKEVALSYRRVRGLYFLAVVFVGSIFHVVQIHVFRLFSVYNSTSTNVKQSEYHL